MKKAYKFLVKGTVQGIFFRQFVKSHAKDLFLTGFVRNLSDGDVEVLAEGESVNLKKFEKLLELGPKHSQIRQVISEEKKWSGDFKDFKILRF